MMLIFELLMKANIVVELGLANFVGISTGAERQRPQCHE